MKKERKGNTAIAGTLSVTGATTVTGATALNGGLTMASNKFVVTDTTGNTAFAGTLGALFHLQERWPRRCQGTRRRMWCQRGRA